MTARVHIKTTRLEPTGHSRRLAMMGATVMLAALTSAPAWTQSASAAAGGYVRVCEDTAITDRPGGTERLVVPEGQRVNTRETQGDHTAVNYPARGWVVTSALC